MMSYPPDGFSRVEVGHRTDRGLKRKSNEDSLLVLLPPDTLEGVDAVLAVADGMGGHQAGEVASGIAVEEVASSLGIAASLAWRNSSPRFDSVLRNIVQQANATIRAESKTEDRQGMGTTLTLASIKEGNLYVAHVGDSRAYLFRDGVLTAITEDHSWVADEVRAGRITPEEALHHPRRNLVTRALGSDVSIVVDTRVVPLRPSDRVLLATDGLHGVLRENAIASAVAHEQNLDAACERLIGLANEEGGPDNVTVIVARYSGPAPDGTPDDGYWLPATVIPADSAVTEPRGVSWVLVAGALALAAGIVGLAAYALLTS